TTGEYIDDEGRTRQDFEGGYMLWKAGYQTTIYDTRTVNNLPPDSGSGSTSTWQVEYWNRPDLVGRPVWSGEAELGDIRFSAGLGAPVGTFGISENNFSARWSTRSYFDGGLYDFISRADDGVRVYIDGVKIIDKWSATAPFSRDDGYVLVPEGEHDVVVEYFEAGGSAALNFTWERNALLPEWAGELLPVGADGSQVHSTYVNTFERHGGIESLGRPLDRVHAWGNGYIQDFLGGPAGRGGIMKSNANDNSFWVGGDIWSAFTKASGANGLLQYPISEAYEIEGGYRQDFQGGAIIQSDHGTFTLYGGIGRKYFELKAENGFLGLPTTGEYPDGGGRTRQDFEGGYILWNESHSAIAYDVRAVESLPADSGQGSTSNWHVQYWNGTDMVGSPEWAGYADEGELRFAAGLGAPVGTWGIGENNFSARWSTTSYFEGGLYDFVSRADDGVRVYVNGTKIIDKWQAAHPFSERSNYVALENGYHRVMVEYFEQGGGAAQTLHWEKVSTAEQWTGEFFNGREIANAPAGFATRSADELNEQWNVGVAPTLLTSSQSGLSQTNVSSDNFVDRWTTTQYFESGGVYEFISRADDGVRVFVDGQLLIDKWQDQPLLTNSAYISLSDGYHHIQVEHYENAGAAANNIRWEKVLPRDIGSGNSQDSLWTVEYFNNKDLIGQPSGLERRFGPALDADRSEAATLVRAAHYHAETARLIEVVVD
ncbi:MAG: PA14 domain-containing protein, partial [Bacteroidota bacterium]